MSTTNTMDHQRAEEYLQRIGYSDPPAPTYQSLLKLQKTHLLKVPFENLDIHFGVAITLDTDLFFEKIVTNKRGGFCYELNSVFGMLLRHIGFDVVQVSARVWAEPSGYGQDFSHLALCINIDDQWYLSDVGFGEFSLGPLKLLPDNVEQDPRGTFRISQDSDQRFVISKDTDAKAIPEYAFYLKHWDLNHFNGMCRYHQSSPDSPFTRKRLISRATENGRVTITDNLLIIKHGDQSETTELRSEADFTAALWKYFEVSL